MTAGRCVEESVNALLCAREALDEVTERLAPEELSVLRRIAERLAMGQREYGKLTLAHDRRDFRREGREEIEDFLVYMACAWLKAGVAQ